MQLIMYIELRDVLRRFHGGADFGDQRMQPEYYLYDGRIRIYTVPGGLRPFMTVLCSYKKIKSIKANNILKFINKYPIVKNNKTSGK